MKEIPILFSTPMVQGILDLLKRMTRRTRGLEKINQDPSSWYLQTLFLHATGRFTFAPVNPSEKITGKDIIEVKCPYGQPGDVLWVRETFTGDIFSGSPNAFIYKASDPNHRNNKERGLNIWKPSIHMPKSAARIWLQVEEIRVERLQDISEEDAIAEGVQSIIRTSGICFMDYTISEYVFPMTAKNSFKSLWKKINGNDWTIGWDLNPWVWVVKFKVLSTTGKPQICYKTNEVCKYDCKGLCRESM